MLILEEVVKIAGYIESIAYIENALIIQSLCSVDSNFNVSFVQTGIETTNN